MTDESPISPKMNTPKKSFSPRLTHNDVDDDDDDDDEEEEEQQQPQPQPQPQQQQQHKKIRKKEGNFLPAS